MADDMPDKEFLYGKYEAGEKRRQRLAHKVAAKALDMDDEDMNIDASKSGIGAAGIVGIGAIAGLPSILLAAFLVWQSMQAQPAQEPPAQPEVNVPDTSYDVLFYDADGKPIKVSHISERPAN